MEKVSKRKGRGRELENRVSMGGGGKRFYCRREKSMYSHGREPRTLISASLYMVNYTTVCTSLVQDVLGSW